MAKYLLLKHYRGAPAAVNDVPMDKWTPAEVAAHIQYMNDFASRLEARLIWVTTFSSMSSGTVSSSRSQARATSVGFAWRTPGSNVSMRCSEAAESPAAATTS